jgi:hypothetical protein
VVSDFTFLGGAGTSVLDCTTTTYDPMTDTIVAQNTYGA